MASPNMNGRLHLTDVPQNSPASFKTKIGLFPPFIRIDFNLCAAKSKTNQFIPTRLWRPNKSNTFEI